MHAAEGLLATFVEAWPLSQPCSFGNDIWGCNRAATRNVGVVGKGTGIPRYHSIPVPGPNSPAQNWTT